MFCSLLEVVLHNLFLFSLLVKDQANPKDKDLPKPTTDLSEDLFKVHDFDVKIDLQVPNAGEMVSQQKQKKWLPLTVTAMLHRYMISSSFHRGKVSVCELQRATGEGRCPPQVPQPGGLQEEEGPDLI